MSFRLTSLWPLWFATVAALLTLPSAAHAAWLAEPFASGATWLGIAAVAMFAVVYLLSMLAVRSSKTVQAKMQPYVAAVSVVMILAVIGTVGSVLIGAVYSLVA